MQTENLSLPLLMPAQAQKHLTHNEALTLLDALVQLAVLDRDLAAPPSDPEPGARFIVAAPGEGAWAGHAGEIAAWQDGAWSFLSPRPGFVAIVLDEEIAVRFGPGGWTPLAGAPTQTLRALGINTAADPVNRLSVTAAATLLNGEAGSHRLTVNKALPADNASLLFQTGFSGRAEIGLAGSDSLRVKVSANGATWTDALVVDAATGAVGIGTAAPAHALHVNAPTASIAIQDRDAPTADGTWRVQSDYQASGARNRLLLANNGAGFGTGGIIADFSKTGTGAPRIGLGGLSADGAIVSVGGNLAAPAAHGLAVASSNSSPSATALVSAASAATAGQRLFAGSGGGTEVFRVGGDGASYFAGRMAVGTGAAPTAAIHAGGAIRLQPYAGEAALPAPAAIGAGGLACVQTVGGLKLMLCDGAGWAEV